MKNDITYLTVRHQLNAFAVEEFDVGILDRIDNTVKTNMICRSFSRSQILSSISWLKHKNSLKNDIFIRPKGSLGLIFFDDVNQSTINKMINDGCEPALVIESSPYNFHGWVRVSKAPIEPTLATQCAKVIANKYHCDQNSADFLHFGRLAGFTNVKPEHVQENGLYPFVKLASRTSKLATNSNAIIYSAQKRLDQIDLKKREIEFVQTNQSIKEALSIAENKYQSLIEYYSSHIDYELNMNAVDWQVCKYLAESGFTKDIIIQCVVQLSHNLSNRKGLGREVSYATRTVEKLFSL